MPEPAIAPSSGLKRTGDGAAVDLTIVRPAAAAPPRRLEQVEQHRRPASRARVTIENMVNAGSS
jgi:hypothetical protein